jgi:hypothetical protein
MPAMAVTDQRKRLLLLALCGIAPFMVNGLVNAETYQNALLYWCFEMLTWIVIPSIVLYLVTRTPGFQFANLGYHGTICGQRKTGLLLLVCVLFAPLCYWVYSTSYDYAFMAIAYLGFRNLWPLVIGHIFTDLVRFG